MNENTDTKEERSGNTGGPDFCRISSLTLETEGSRFLGKYQSHANETAIYVVSGAACSQYRDRILDRTSGFTLFPEVLVAWQRDRDILGQQLDFVYNHVTNVQKVDR